MSQVHAGTHFVECVDGLVGEETVVDVSVCQFDTRQNGILGIAHMVVLFVAVLDVMENLDGVLHIGRLHDDFLETAFQGTVLFNGIAVFIEGGGTDALYGTTCQCRLQDVCGIHAARRASGTYHGVNLIDEDDDVGIVFYLLDECLDTLFKLAAILSTGNNAGHIEVDKPFVEEDGAGALLHNQLCQSFYDGTLTHTGFTDEHGIVLLAATEDLGDTLNLAFTAHHGVKFSLCGSLGKVSTEVVKNRCS